MMKKLGFNEIWISRVMTCVKSVSYVVLVNGQPGPVFFPTRGLIQGNPISPFLYLICTKGLSSLLDAVDFSEKLKGFKVVRGSLSINHIFFADENIAFCRAKIRNWQTIQDVLDIYETATGQRINKHKIGIFFSSNTNRTIKGKI